MNEMNINITEKSKLLSLCDKASWSNYLSKLPATMQDIYYTPAYYEIYEKNGDGQACCFVYEDNNNVAIYPFLLNPIEELGYELDKTYYDIQGAYGYNGVLSSSDDPGFIQNFYEEFFDFCNRRNIIAEFTRFHPLLNNSNFSKEYLTVTFNRKTVYVDLTLGYDQIYKSYKKDVRENLRAANNNNLYVEIYKNEFPYKDDFVEMYNESMDVLNARDYLQFKRELFDNTFSKLPLVQFVVFKNKLPISSIICIYYGGFLHAHLSGSRKEFLSYRPTNLVFDQIIRYGIEKGFQKLHFGGGRTTDEKDSLLTFKKKHSSTISEYYIGSKVYNEDIYNNICNQWSTKYPHLINKYDNMILKYRNCK